VNVEAVIRPSGCRGTGAGELEGGDPISGLQEAVLGYW